MCLANKLAVRIPDSLEKLRLQKAGLGVKKVQVFLNDDEETVFNKITEAFPQVRGCGGIEIMSCVSNSRDLTVLNCSLAA